jgi:hypothetical protein
MPKAKGFFILNNMKTCSKCKVDKSLNDFCKNKTRSDGYHSVCKICKNKYDFDNKERKRNQDKIYRTQNKEKVTSKYLKWLKNNKDKRREYNKEYNKQYRIDNLDKIKEVQKKYRLNNKESINKKVKYKKINNPLYRLIHNIRSLISISLKRQGYLKTSKTHQILGCSFEDLKIHLENQFIEGMTWENRSLWHIDHIYPVSLAKDEQHLIELNHYSNLQPLWAEDNIKKSNKI